MSRRADAARGSCPLAADPQPSSGVGPACITALGRWPRASYLELGALPSAVPPARLHARLVVAEWGLGSIADTVELIVSELVTNGVKASQALDHLSPVWLGLAGDEHQVFVAVWDGNDEPMQTPVASDDELLDLEAEGGRGLLLVDSLSTDWGVYGLKDGRGKVVWAVATDPEAPTTAEHSRAASQASLPRRVPHLRPVMRPVQAMADLAVLRRVRDGLRGLE
jgi:anti-sigma regulatory factor (Ser/Thr protein kinase)